MVADGRAAPQDRGGPVRPTREEALAAAELLSAYVLRDGPESKDTGGRMLRALEEMTAGLDVDPLEILGRTFEAEHDEIVLVRGIRFTSLCEHHLLPVDGSACVAYIPAGRRVVGLSKIPRLVDAFARRPHLQERMTAQIADALMAALKPIGAAAIVRGEHACMSCRGVRQWDADMVTSCMRGAFFDKPEARAELLSLIGRL